MKESVIRDSQVDAEYAKGLTKSVDTAKSVFEKISSDAKDTFGSIMEERKAVHRASVQREQDFRDRIQSGATGGAPFETADIYGTFFGLLVLLALALDVSF